MKSKILLVYSYSAKNAGDLAITLGALDTLYNENVEVSTISRYSEDDEQFKESKKYLSERYPRLTILPSPFGLNRETSKLGLIKQYLNGFLKILGIKSNKEFRNIIKSFDKVYFNGGNILRCSSITDFIRLIAFLNPLKIALNSNIPVTILPQSTYKINYFGRFLIRPIFRAAQKVYCREKMSFDTLIKYFPKAPLHLNTDMAFFINHKIKAKGENIKRIAITTRSQTIGDIDQLPKKKQQKIYDNLVELTIYFLRKNYNIVFVVQTKADHVFTQRVYSNFSKDKRVAFFENYNPVELIKFYSNCDMLIGMRLHSIILALTAGTPCVGFFEKSWGLKNQGIMEAYNQRFVYIDDSSLISLTDKHLSIKKRTATKDISDVILKYEKEIVYNL